MLHIVTLHPAFARRVYNLGSNGHDKMRLSKGPMAREVVSRRLSDSSVNLEPIFSSSFANFGILLHDLLEIFCYVAV